MRRVLVTGATGFLGGHLVRSLTGNDHVIATGRSSVLDQLAKLSNVSVVRADLSDRHCVEDLAATKPTLIVHAAALSSPWGPRRAFELANITATDHVIEVAERCSAPMVAISTPTIYMNGGDRYQIPEDAPLVGQQINDYAATKLVAEQRVSDAAVRSALPVAILRPQAIIGPGDPSVAPRFLRVADKGFFPLIDGGRAELDMTHVANVVAAITAALDRVATNAWDGVEIFNITNGDPRPIVNLVERFLAARAAHRDGQAVRMINVSRRRALRVAAIMETVARRTGNWEPPVTRYSIQAIADGRTLDIDRARRLLGYEPSRHSIEDAFDSYFADLSPSFAAVAP